MRIRWRGMPNGRWHREEYADSQDRTGVARVLKDRRKRFRVSMGGVSVPHRGHSWGYYFPHLDSGTYWFLQLTSDEGDS